MFMSAPLPPQSTLWMPSTPNSLACAILLLCQPTVGLLALELSKQPDKEQDAHLYFLQVPQSLLEMLLETLPCS